MTDMPLFDRIPDEPPRGGPERIYRVAEINRAARLLVEQGLGDVWIEGELSDVRPSAAGHVYFALNDGAGRAQLRGVMFRADARRAKARLADGARVRMRGQVSLFEPRGQFQFLARIALPDGAGDLAAELERRKRALEAEGLTDPSRKRRLPRLPRVLGVVTSVTGAALHDVVRVASGRCPVRIVVADCRVQGDGAPASILRALELVQRVPELDVIIVGRGGGSAEDLWAFNDEAVARAIAACRVPTVSAVGHEVDFTLADLVADVRAATPSNAAELCVPDRRALLAELAAADRRLVRAMEVQVDQGRLRLEREARKLGDPRRALGPIHRRLRALHEQLGRGARSRVGAPRERLHRIRERLALLDPRVVLQKDRRRLAELDARLARAGRAAIERRRRALLEARAGLLPRGRPLVGGARARLREAMARLDALSPLAVLDRGYAIALDASDKAVRSVAELPEGRAFRLALPDGAIDARSLGPARGAAPSRGATTSEGEGS
jgi:exodeoxyribonuclease VII large subunit